MGGANGNDMPGSSDRLRIAVAMSGGVDSSTVAALLHRQGHDVVGLHMRLFPREGCRSDPAGDARGVADFLGIPFHLVDLSADFCQLVIDEFRASYLRGETPNPCVRCNRLIKFGLLQRKARALGAALLATGHYVRRTLDAQGTCHLRMALDRRKDQSYFLYSLSQTQLAGSVFPLGGLTGKAEVRRLAAEFGLPVAAKGDSQEVCFIPGDDYVAYLEQSAGVAPTPGDIFHLDGRLVGRHAGTYRYTIGQRRGLGIAWREPLYVVALDTVRNRVIVGERQHVNAAGLLADNVSWIVPPEGDPLVASCKIRYRHGPVRCTIQQLPGGRAEVRFAQPQQAVTPGQSVVFYRDDEVLGGGIIAAPIGGAQADTDTPEDGEDRPC